MNNNTMIIRKVPRTEYDIKIEPCCRRADSLFKSGDIIIDDNKKLRFSKDLVSFEMGDYCMYCGAQIFFADK